MTLSCVLLFTIISPRSFELLLRNGVCVVMTTSSFEVSMSSSLPFTSKACKIAGSSDPPTKEFLLACSFSLTLNMLLETALCIFYLGFTCSAMWESLAFSMIFRLVSSISFSLIDNFFAVNPFIWTSLLLVTQAVLLLFDARIFCLGFICFAIWETLDFPVLFLFVSSIFLSLIDNFLAANPLIWTLLFSVARFVSLIFVAFLRLRNSLSLELLIYSSSKHIHGVSLGAHSMSILRNYITPEILFFHWENNSAMSTSRSTSQRDLIMFIVSLNLNLSTSVSVLSNSEISGVWWLEQWPKAFVWTTYYCILCWWRTWTVIVSSIFFWSTNWSIFQRAMCDSSCFIRAVYPFTPSTSRSVLFRSKMASRSSISCAMVEHPSTCKSAV